MVSLPIANISLDGVLLGALDAQFFSKCLPIDHAVHGQAGILVHLCNMIQSTHSKLDPLSLALSHSPLHPPMDQKVHI